jgi:hypothetical protein
MSAPVIKKLRGPSYRKAIKARVLRHTPPLLLGGSLATEQSIRPRPTCACYKSRTTALVHLVSSEFLSLPTSADLGLVRFNLTSIELSIFRCVAKPLVLRNSATEPR